MMKKTAFLFGLLAVSAFAGGAFAAEGAKVPPLGTTVALIDVQRVLQESSAAQSVQKQLEAQRAKFQAEISKEEGDLRKAEQELVKERDTAKPDVYADKEQQLRQRFLGVEKHVQARRKALDQAFSDSMNTVRKSLLDIVGAYAKERHIGLVVVKQQTLWSEPNMDITDDVLTKLNKTIEKVPVKIVAEPSDDEKNKK